MPPIDQTLKDHIVSLPDEVLVRVVEGKSEEYTPEAIEFAKAEIARRGGMEALKQKAAELAESTSHAEDESPSEEKRRRLKILYPVFVLVAYGLFMYAISASLWLYWLGLFAFIGSLFAVLFIRRKVQLEEENKKIEGSAPQEINAKPSVPESTNDQPEKT